MHSPRPSVDGPRTVGRREVRIGAHRVLKLSLTVDTGGATVWFSIEGDGRVVTRSFMPARFARDVATALWAMAREAEQ